MCPSALPTQDSDVGTRAIATATILSLGLLARAPDARADASTANRCASASEQAQLRRLQGRLVEARDDLIVCSHKSCPSLVRKDCDRWLGEVETALPSIVLAARDDTGADLVDVEVSLDDKPVTDLLDGKAMLVDPGTHKLRASVGGRSPVEKTFVAREGEKLRSVEIVFPVDGATSTAGLPARTVAGWTLVGAGGLAAILGTYLAVRQASDYSDAERECAPTCPIERKDDIDSMRVYSGIAFGIGAAAIAGGLWLLLGRPSKPRAAWVGPTGFVF